MRKSSERQIVMRLLILLYAKANKNGSPAQSSAFSADLARPAHSDPTRAPRAFQLLPVSIRFPARGSRGVCARQPQHSARGRSPAGCSVARVLWLVESSASVVDLR